MTTPPADTTTPPRVLILHNRYRQPGGEDVIAAAQAQLLKERGHAVRVFEKDNREIDRYGLFRKAMLFVDMAGNARAAAEVDDIAKVFKPDVALIHNTLPLLSPSVYGPLQRRGVKVIQYLHNYRLVCPAGTLYRENKSCTLCVDDGLKHAVKHKCWSHSTFASLGVTRMLDRHRRAQTWHTQVDLFVALNSYQRELLVKSKVVPEGRIVVQPNFLLLNESPASGPGDGFVFAGRLTPEKGIATLLKAAALVPEMKLTVLGDGPLREKLTPGANVQLLGHQPKQTVLERLKSARAVVIPSEWHEGFPMSVVEAMAMGRAVIASRMAGPLEIVQDGVTGLMFDAGNVEQLAACLRKLQHDPAFAEQLGRSGRQRFETECSADAGYQRLRENFARIGAPVTQE